jgi:DNA helicase HerA-like ATPase
MLGRVTRLWELGRASGLGGSAITQRPASLSKNITTQAEILIVHRTLGPQDVAAVREWIRYHGERDDILGELATLKTGEAFI